MIIECLLAAARSSLDIYYYLEIVIIISTVNITLLTVQYYYNTGLLYNTTERLNLVWWRFENEEAITIILYHHCVVSTKHPIVGIHSNTIQYNTMQETPIGT